MFYCKPMEFGMLYSCRQTRNAPLVFALVSAFDFLGNDLDHDETPIWLVAKVMHFTTIGFHQWHVLTTM